jgi:hypothetical protein
MLTQWAAVEGEDELLKMLNDFVLEMYMVEGDDVARGLRR